MFRSTSCFDLRIRGHLSVARPECRLGAISLRQRKKLMLSLCICHIFVIILANISGVNSRIVVFKEREEDQQTLVLTWECLRLLGNALVALSDLRLNLMSPVPRHLHVVRPFSHYAGPGAVHHHIPVQVRKHGRSLFELVCGASV